MTAEPFGPVDELRKRAEQAVAGVREQLDSAREAQRQALATTGEATSRDGTVKVTVNAAGVLTALEIDERALTAGGAKALANLVVATVQAAARQSAERVQTSLGDLHQRSDALLAVAGRKPTELSALRRELPDVPDTATDPLADKQDPPSPSPQEKVKTGDRDGYFEREKPW